MDTPLLKRLHHPDLAYNHLPGADLSLPTVLFLGGFRSDRHGTKATHLQEFCRARGQAYIRFDYSGHGDSAGEFSQGTIESWRDDAAAILDHLVAGPVILVGSSMGGWIGLLLALGRPKQVKGFVGIAAAPDFTRDMLARFTPDMQRDYTEKGYATVPNHYSPEPYMITRALIESGNKLGLLDHQHDLTTPMSLLQGKCDTEVPWSMPARIRAAFPQAPITVTLIDDGDHSLSRPQDLDVLDAAIISVCI